jgi:ribosomal protein S18 acetylase RimI-like enzyme
VAPAVALRPVEPSDERFLAALYASTRERELALVPWTDEQRAAFVWSQFQAQSAHYAGYEGAAYSVVEVDGEPAGRLYLARWPEEVRVVDIALLPAFRGRGIGTRLLRDVLAQAGGRRVTIHVERDNPARRLYERLGFAPVPGEGGPVYDLLQANTAS